MLPQCCCKRTFWICFHALLLKECRASWRYGAWLDFEGSRIRHDLLLPAIAHQTPIHPDAYCRNGLKSMLGALVGNVKVAPLLCPDGDDVVSDLL